MVRTGTLLNFQPAAFKRAKTTGWKCVNICLWEDIIGNTIHFQNNTIYSQNQVYESPLNKRICYLIPRIFIEDFPVQNKRQKKTLTSKRNLWVQKWKGAQRCWAKIIVISWKIINYFDEKEIWTNKNEYKAGLKVLDFYKGGHLPAIWSSV